MKATHAGKTREGLRLREGETEIKDALARVGYSLDTVPHQHRALASTGFGSGVHEHD